MLLEFEHVTGTSGKFRLEDIHFSLPAGFIMGLAGKNGAGKTTLMDYIMNPKKQYNGTIRINGVDIRENHVQMRNQIGFVSDVNQFLVERTANQNAEILGSLYDKWDMKLFQETMRKMDLSIAKTVGKMSRGEMMKFQLAFAVAHKPALYLLDEVTAGMDPVFRIDFFKMLQEIICTEEVSVLLTSHIQTEIGQKTDYVGIMENGRLIEFGESLDLVK